jgi:hypothetical protein
MYLYIYIYLYDISSLRVNQLLYCVSLKIYNKFANYGTILTKFINYFIASDCNTVANKLPLNGSRRAGHLHARRDGKRDTALCKVGISFNAGMRDGCSGSWRRPLANYQSLVKRISTSCTKRKDNKRGGLLVCFCLRCQSFFASFSFIVYLLHSSLFLCSSACRHIVL